ncbi:MAG: hypothetical protein JNM60_07845 [Candidatus Competibacteraceae bacterium]|nr:hypothetical protein [Candidatus Competibacteraceae bacterium]
MRLAWVVWVGMALAVNAAATRAQDGRPDARVSLTGTAYGFLVGVNQGRGKLIFKERQYPFSMSAIKVGTLGYTRVDAEGQVYRLRDLADFPGRYYAVEGAFTVGQGGGGTVLRNEKGVMLYLQNLHKGVELTLGGSSVDIAFAEPSVSPSTVPAEAGAR